MNPSGPRMRGAGDDSQLDRLTDDMKRDTENAANIDWKAVDAKLFDRVKAEVAADQAARARRGSPRRLWIPVAAALAAAAAVAMFVGNGHEGTSLDEPRVAAVDEQAGSLVLREGAGDVLVDGRAIALGGALPLGARVETTGGARAMFEKKGKVSFWIEPTTKARVSSVAGSIVLALESGAVEAEVVPVARGEAFAIDVRGARVAVHGTHLRAAVDANSERVVVDLTEGVVAIGNAPRVGATQGDLVTAPAHAEFVASDVHGTLRVDHSTGAVRPAVAFAIVVPSSEPPIIVAEGPGVVVDPNPTAAMPSPRQVPPPVAPVTTKLEPTPVATQAQTPPTPPTMAAGAPQPTQEPAAHTPPPALTVQPTIERDPHADLTIANAVRACLAARLPAQGISSMTVSTTLELQVSDMGTVLVARFVPPLAPEVQACAANVIYRTRFVRGGAVSIPIEYTYRR